VHLPGIDVAAALAEHLGESAGAWAREEAHPPDRAQALLGRKGLLAKDPATRLALCAVHRALGLDAGRRPRASVSPTPAVVACSNQGNVETVAAVARTIAAEGGRAVSMLDAPNVSSNVIASSVALWFGLGGPNLMVCSGATAGLDGLRLAGLLLRARRAERVILVGAEAAGGAASALYPGGEHGLPLRGGAACVVLERGDGRGGRVLVQPMREREPLPLEPRITVGPAGFDPAAHWGDTYGARGVVALALAAHLAADEGYQAVAVRDESEDGSGGALVSALHLGQDER
jgi:hypothetical protein